MLPTISLCFFLIHLLLFFKWVINGSIHKKPIQDIPTELVQNFPRCFCCSSVFCLEWCQALPSLSQDSLSKAAAYAVPCSHYSQTRTAAHLGDTNTHLHIVEAPTITCSLIGSAEVSLVTLLKQNTYRILKERKYLWFQLMLTLLRASHRLSLVWCLYLCLLITLAILAFLVTQRQTDRWQQSVKKREVFHFNLQNRYIPTHLSCLRSIWS